MEVILEAMDIVRLIKSFDNCPKLKVYDWPMFPFLTQGKTADWLSDDEMVKVDINLLWGVYQTLKQRK